MRRKKIWLALLASAMVAGSASAALLTGPMSVTNTLQQNWGVTYGLNQVNAANNNVWNPTQGDFIVTDGNTTPGAGGQDFDIEAMYSGFHMATNTFYVTIVTGFNLFGEYSPVNPYNYYVGDVFLDFGLDGNTNNSIAGVEQWDLAFDLSYMTDSSAAINTDATFGAPISLNAYTGNVTGSDPLTPGYPDSRPYRINGGTLESGSVSFMYYRGGTDSNHTASQSPSDHNIYNFAYDLTGKQSLIDELFTNQTNQGAGYMVHWTMSCGNDVSPLVGQAVPGNYSPPVVPVPAAAPMGLLGMVALGLFRKVRAKKS